MKLDIITPEKILYSAQASQVQVPGTLGDFGVLPGHAPFISTLRPGIITVDSDEGSRRIAVTGGLAEANPQACTILAESAEDVTGWTASDIEKKRETAKAALDEARTDTQRQQAEKQLALADLLAIAA